MGRESGGKEKENKIKLGRGEEGWYLVADVHLGEDRVPRLRCGWVGGRLLRHQSEAHLHLPATRPVTSGPAQGDDGSARV